MPGVQRLGVTPGDPDIPPGVGKRNISSISKQIGEQVVPEKLSPNEEDDLQSMGCR